MTEKSATPFTAVKGGATLRPGAAPPASAPTASEPGNRTNVEPAPQRTVAGHELMDTKTLHALLPVWVERDGVKVKPRPVTANVEAIALHHGNIIRYNEMVRTVEISIPSKEVPADDLNTKLTMLGDLMESYGISRAIVPEAVEVIARRNAYRPVIVRIEGTPWDGIDRRMELFNSLDLAAPAQKPLAARLLNKFMLQCIGALYEPGGISAAGMLVLAGPQGCGKTRWVRALAMGVDRAMLEGLTIDPRDKDTLIRALSTWIAELGELDGTMRKADIAALKVFITDRLDTLREPYGRKPVQRARRTSLAGTVNNLQFLVDDTSNRRFWVIEVRACHPIDPQVMQQIWAQYLVRYRAGERWYLEPELMQALNEANQMHEVSDPIYERAAKRFPWETVDVQFITEENRTRHPQLCWLTATEVCERVGIFEPTKADVTRAGTAIQKLWSERLSVWKATVPPTAQNPQKSAPSTLFTRRSGGGCAW